MLTEYAYHVMMGFRIKPNFPLHFSLLSTLAMDGLKATNKMANDGVPITDPAVHPIELSFPLPKSPDTRIHLQLTIQTTSLLLFLTTALNGDTSAAAPLGSFVYALPDVGYLISVYWP